MSEPNPVEVMDECQRFVGIHLYQLCRNVITLKLTSKMDHASALELLVKMLRPVAKHNALSLAESMVAYAAMEAQAKP
jgi:hypothetical protein